MKHKEFLAKIDRAAVGGAIERAEKSCDGEIRVHVQPKAHGGDIRTVAERTFERLGMTKTAARNGVLLFIASEEERFVILGDKGIHEIAGDDFWNGIAAELTTRFKQGEFTEGIVEAIHAAGSLLAQHFPPTAGDVDELSNELSVDDHDSQH
jgi:uncharacterized membrane protein